MKKLRLCSYCSPVILIYTCKKSYDKNRVVKLDHISHINHDNEAMSSLDIASFFCALSLTEECFLFQQNPCFIYHRHNPLHLYAYIRCATYARDGRGLCRRCDGVNILFIDFFAAFSAFDTLNVRCCMWQRRSVLYSKTYHVFRKYLKM